MMRTTLGRISDGISDFRDAVRQGNQALSSSLNLYDWYVCVRGGIVEALWPITARGALH